ncbi:hypothetical protein DM01DRAFT_1334323 [Hesseltinella vesiculosa]|uniref:Uncharacterized protein n=1 Tax=Hesseltinella vesiculosa TaxID=101127 RepID=A0A1X2GLN3_9FUNG|nr:hypothetical protein DM01DRAFT_1334323 [Hesseltinella vesiculosa]
MGATDSKLAFRKSVFRLFEENNISNADDDYWTLFWTLPETANDVFSLVSATDIRRARDTAKCNLEILLDKTIQRMHAIIYDPAFLSGQNTTLQLLNCTRILVRILPFLFEQANEEWESSFFWLQRQDTSINAGSTCRGDHLLSLVVRALFMPGFTLPANLKLENQNTNYVIWETGIGSSAPIGSFRDNESNRVEILRLLLVLLSKSMYIPTSQFLSKQADDRWLHNLAFNSEKKVVMCLLCSLLNTSCNYNPLAWGGTSASTVFSDTREQLVTLSARVLCLALDAYSPASLQYLTESEIETDACHVDNSDSTQSIIKEWECAAQGNLFLYYTSKIHRAQDFQFLIDGIYRTLSYPLQGFNTYLPTSIKRSPCYYEMTTLCWKLMQFNSRFRTYLVETERSFDLMVAVLYHSVENRSDTSQLGLVRVSILVLQCLSVNRRFGDKINKVFEEASYAALPSIIKVDASAPFKGTYADFLILSLFKLIATTNGQLSILYPSFITIINNVSPYLKCISVPASTKLISLFGSFSAPGFLAADENNPAIVQYFVELFGNVIQCHASENAHFLYCLLQNRSKFERLANFDLDDSANEAVITVSEKAMGKMPHVSRTPSSSSLGFVPNKQWLNLWRDRWHLGPLLEWIRQASEAIATLTEEQSLSAIRAFVVNREYCPKQQQHIRHIPWSQSVVIGARSALWAHVYLTTPTAISPWHGSSIRLFQIKTQK